MRGEESVFKEYADESRMVCSRNYGIVAEYGDVEQALRERELVNPSIGEIFIACTRFNATSGSHTTTTAQSIFCVKNGRR